MLHSWPSPPLARGRLWGGAMVSYSCWVPAEHKARGDQVLTSERLNEYMWGAVLCNRIGSRSGTERDKNYCA